MSWIAAGIGAAIFDPDGGAQFLLEPLVGMVAFSAFAILAQRWQREDGVSLRGRPVERLPRTHSLRYRRAT